MNKFYLLILATLAFACGEAAKTAVSTAEAPAEGVPVIHRFENEIRAFEKADSMASPPQDFVLFVGSSSVRMWKTIAKDLAPLPVLNRGFGGSNFEDLLYFSDRIVFKYQPSAVVVYEGDNDIVSDTLKPEHVAMRMGMFQELMQEKLPGVPTYFLSVKPSIARKNLLEKAQATNQLIQKMAAEDEMLTYIDVATPMMTADGKIRADIFIDDSLHMNATGYGLWTEVVRGHLVP
ncbi:MAG: GDSL-type esterase/lipase family protein [Bacteroidota bacterium]